MSDTCSRASRANGFAAILVEFLDWGAARPRTYVEEMGAWRTSCPWLSAWEDATGDDLVRVEQSDTTKQGEDIVLLTERGTAF